MLRMPTYMRGVTAIEVAVGVSIAAVILIYTTYAVTQFINSARDISAKTEALYLAEDGLELVRYVRDAQWSTLGTLSLDTPYYLAVTPTTIQVGNTPEVIGNYTRSFVVQNVYRDATTDDIVASTTSGSVADSDSKYITMYVNGGNPTTTVSLTTLLADIEP